MPIPINPSLAPVPDDVLTTIGVEYRVTSISEVAGGVGALIFILSTLAIFLCILWSGVQWMTSGADKAKLQGARSRLINCLIGLSIISLAWALIILIQYFFGLEVFEGFA